MAPYPSALGSTRQVGLAPQSVEIGALIGLVLLTGAAYLVGFHGLINIATPLALGGIMGIANWSMARRASEGLWTPLFAFRLAVLVFMGIGGITPFIAGEAVVEHLMTLYPYSPQELAKTHFVWLSYTTLVIAFCRFGGLFFRAETGASKPLPEQTSAMGLGLMFFTVGFSVSVVIGLAIATGWVEVIPASFMLPFEAASAVGIFLIAYDALERGGWRYVAVAAAVLSNIVLGLVLYTKTLILFPILFVGLAVLMHGVTAVRVLGVAAALGFALTVMQPANAYARELHSARHGSHALGGTIVERLQTSIEYWTAPPNRQVSRGEGLSRLSYNAIGSYLVTEYDLGLHGDTISAAGYALIPRLIWPDKPIVTEASNELSFRVTGQYTNALAPTTAGDIYWNYGWLGILLMAPALGVLLWVATTASYRILQARDWFMMPFVLIAFRIGLSADGSFVIAIFAPAAAAFVAFVALRFIKTLLSRRGTAPAGAVPSVGFGSIGLQERPVSVRPAPDRRLS